MSHVFLYLQVSVSPKYLPITDHQSAMQQGVSKSHVICPFFPSCCFPGLLVSSNLFIQITFPSIVAVCLDWVCGY